VCSSICVSAPWKSKQVAISKVLHEAITMCQCFSFTVDKLPSKFPTLANSHAHALANLSQQSLLHVVNLLYLVKFYFLAMTSFCFVLWNTDPE
jgi:hypothetical protein